MILILSTIILIFEAVILIFFTMILIFDLDQKVCDLLQLCGCVVGYIPRMSRHLELGARIEKGEGPKV